LVAGRAGKRVAALPRDRFRGCDGYRSRNAHQAHPAGKLHHNGPSICEARAASQRGRGPRHDPHCDRRRCWSASIAEGNRSPGGRRRGSLERSDRSLGVSAVACCLPVEGIQLVRTRIIDRWNVCVGAVKALTVIVGALIGIAVCLVVLSFQVALSPLFAFLVLAGVGLWLWDVRRSPTGSSGPNWRSFFLG